MLFHDKGDAVKHGNAYILFQVFLLRPVGNFIAFTHAPFFIIHRPRKPSTFRCWDEWAFERIENRFQAQEIKQMAFSCAWTAMKRMGMLPFAINLSLGSEYMTIVQNDPTAGSMPTALPPTSSKVACQCDFAPLRAAIRVRPIRPSFHFHASPSVGLAFGLESYIKQGIPLINWMAKIGFFFILRIFRLL